MAKFNLKTKKLATFDNVVLVVAIVEPLSSLPQILELFSTQNAESLSLLTWLLFAVGSVVWLIYGLKMKNLPLIASSFIWVSTEIALVIGILLYS